MDRIYIFMFAWVKMSNFNHQAKEIMMKCFEPNWSLFSCKGRAYYNFRAPYFCSSVSPTIQPRQTSSKELIFFSAHTSEGQIESKRQGEKERGKGWQQVTTIHPADCLHNPSSNSSKWRSEWFKAQTLSLLSDASHRLPVPHLFYYSQWWYYRLMKHLQHSERVS